MLQVLHPTYDFRVTVQGDALKGGVWNGLDAKSGCDEMWDRVRKALAAAGLHADVMLDKFEHRPPINARS